MKSGRYLRGECRRQVSLPAYGLVWVRLLARPPHFAEETVGAL